MEDPHGHRISYLRISVTDRCNERCRYCMPQEVQEWLPREGILSYEEILRITKVGASLGIKKIRVTGGEPLTRKDIVPFLEKLCAIEGIDEVGISTNGTLLSSEVKDREGKNMAESLKAAGLRTVNISLDTLDRAAYLAQTGRDYLQKALDGIDAARDAGFEKIKINSVLIKGTSEEQLIPLIDFARDRDLLLRFIELMPVTTEEMLHEDNFLSSGAAKKLVEQHYGSTLQARPDFRTNGPASYFEIPESDQLVGFIGAMTNLHFCESCNKLRLTSDGKLRPCLGSYLEFDMMSVLRDGATDEELAQFFKDVVDRKPLEHDFRNNYTPNRKMVAIGG